MSFCYNDENANNNNNKNLFDLSNVVDLYMLLYSSLKGKWIYFQANKSESNYLPKMD